MTTGGGGDPHVFYRRFENNRNCLVDHGDGTYTIASALFKTDDLSVEDGAYTSPDQTALRGLPKSCGVVAVPKDVVVHLGLTVHPDDPNASDYRIEHYTIRGITHGKAKRLRTASRIVVSIHGVVVRNGDGSMPP